MSRFKNNWKKFADKLGGTPLYWQVLCSQGELFAEYQRLFKKYLKKSSRVLDLGAGRLFYRETIKQFTPHYESIDFQKTHPDLDYVGTASKTGLKTGSYDVVFCAQVLEHVPDPQESFQEIARILKPGGHAIIAVPFLMYLHNEPYDFQRLTKHALENYAKNADLSVVELREVGGLMSFFGAITAMVLIGGFWSIPVLGWVAYWLNIGLQKLFRFIDDVSKNKSVFPGNYLLVVKK